MTGGDFPAWLPTLFAIGAAAQACAANLVDRRGECIHAGCPHYRVCFIEKAIRASRRADLVIANHALVMTQAAFDGARTARGRPADVETAHLKRIVFDEGHHLFDAADAAFSASFPAPRRPRCAAGSAGPRGAAGAAAGWRRGWASCSASARRPATRSPRRCAPRPRCPAKAGPAASRRRAPWRLRRQYRQ